MIAIGRREVLGLYERAGLRSHGLHVKAGAVTYELMSADVRRLRNRLEEFEGFIRRFERSVDWRVDGVSYRPEDACLHGGAFWEAIGDSFETLERKERVISAGAMSHLCAQDLAADGR
jgi:hypothetical protein